MVLVVVMMMMAVMKVKMNDDRIHCRDHHDHVTTMILDWTMGGGGGEDDDMML